MKQAREDYNRIQDPAGLIPEDEPVFLLRGQDKLAPALLEQWAHNLMAQGGDLKMANMVMEHATKMRHWQREHIKKLPDLPK